MNCTQIIIFGATGDLASLKLFPAIYELYKKDLLPQPFQIIGYGRSALSKNAFQKLFRTAVEKKIENEKDQQKLSDLLKNLEYFAGQYGKKEDFDKFGQFCLELANGCPIDQIAYFSVPPTIFESLVLSLATQKKNTNNLKIVIEKPFGSDEKSAEHLFRIISENFEEKDVFLLDHFLGKRPIQSIYKLRLDNNVINLILKPEEIANIQITALEKVDASKRVGYYEQVGCLKDMIQSHLLQILTLITMSIPLNTSIERLQREKQNILSAVRFSGSTEDIIFGQYESYTALEGVAKNSQTETMVALKLQIDRREWFNTPIYFRTGKKLDQHLTKVVIEFKKLPSQKASDQPNRLIFEMKPMERVSLKLIQEKPTKDSSEKEELHLEQGLSCSSGFCLGDYSSLIFDIIRGKKLFFLSYPEIIAAWKVIDEVDQLRLKGQAPIHKYKDDSTGPTAYLNLPQKEGFNWN